MKNLTCSLFWLSFVLALLSIEPALAYNKQHRKKLIKDREDREQKDINVCDIDQNDSPLYCYCNDNKLQSADDVNCLIFKRLVLSDPIWAHFNSQMYIKKLTFKVKSDGSIDYVPTAVLQQLKSLNTINFEYAKLDAIESQAFASIHSVSTINLSKNAINVLKWHAFEGLRNLTLLNLEDNNISEMSKDIFYDVPRLQRLFLNNNNVSILHDKAFKHLPALQELQLNSNKISSLAVDSFAGLTFLQRLDLGNNLITMLGERVFVEMPELLELNLEQNKIKFISNRALDGLKNLKTLRLGDNKLMNLEPDFLVGAPSINLLDLRNNALRTMTFDNIKPVITNFYNNSSHFLLDGNKLVCDCKLTWIWGLRNETRNPTLKENLQELKCLLEASYETKFDQSGDNYNHALQIVRGESYRSQDEYLGDNNNNDYNFPDEDYEMSMKVGHQLEVDGKMAYVRNLFDLKPELLPCPKPSREDVMASEQPSGRQDLSSSFFSFVNSAESSQTTYVTLVMVTLGVFLCFT